MKALSPAPAVATDTWSQAWRSSSFRMALVGTLLLLAMLLLFFARFLLYVEARPGALLPDPFLALFAPHDVTWLTFSLIYLALPIWFIAHSRHPRLLVMALQGYGLMVAFRIIAMYALPLEPPAGMIPLQDPFVRFFGPSQLLTKDLFFSGHTATIFLLSLFSKNRTLRIYFLVSAIAVALCVLAQHVHYSVDVVVAPFVAYTASRIVRGWWEIGRKKG